MRLGKRGDVVMALKDMAALRLTMAPHTGRQADQWHPTE